MRLRVHQLGHCARVSTGAPGGLPREVSSGKAGDRTIEVTKPIDFSLILIKETEESQSPSLPPSAGAPLPRRGHSLPNSRYATRAALRSWPFDREHPAHATGIPQALLSNFSEPWWSSAVRQRRSNLSTKGSRYLQGGRSSDIHIEPLRTAKHSDLALDRRRKPELVTRHDGKTRKLRAVRDPHTYPCSGDLYLDELRQR